MKVYIYIIKCPETNNVVYVGKANDLEKRIKSHHLDSKSRKRKICRWINDCVEKRITPIFEIYKETDTENWCEEEIKAIAHFRESYDLLNVANGGMDFCPKETRAKNGASVAKSLHDDPKRKRMWYLKKELAQFFKRNPTYHRIPYMRAELNKRGIYI